jgi:hypothetical protein
MACWILERPPIEPTANEFVRKILSTDSCSRIDRTDGRKRVPLPLRLEEISAASFLVVYLGILLVGHKDRKMKV